MKEDWKPITGLIGAYSISSIGRVRSEERTIEGDRGYRRTFPEKLMKPLNNGNGYMSVVFWTGNKQKRVYIHRLVAEHFIANPSAKPQVNHLDGDKSNNQISNLAWSTEKENMSHAYSTGLAKSGENCKFSVLKKEDVIEIYSTKGKVNAKELASKFGISTGQIWKIRAGIRWKKEIAEYEESKAI